MIRFSAFRFQMKTSKEQTKSQRQLDTALYDLHKTGGELHWLYGEGWDSTKDI